MLTQTMSRRWCTPTRHRPRRLAKPTSPWRVSHCTRTAERLRRNRQPAPTRTERRRESRQQMAYSVAMPALGESVTEGTVTRWLKHEGETVEVDEPLVEVSTDKVDTEIPSPAAGVLERIVVPEDETVEVGAELAVIGDASDPSARPHTAPRHAASTPTASTPTASSPTASSPTASSPTASSPTAPSPTASR